MFPLPRGESGERPRRSFLEGLPTRGATDAAGTKPGEVGTVLVGVGRVLVDVIVSISVTIGVTEISAMEGREDW